MRIFSKGKLFGIISIIDILILILLGVMVFEVYDKYFSSKNSNPLYIEKFKYTLQVKGISIKNANSYEKGQIINEKITNNCIGKIVDIQINNAIGELQLDDGTVIMTEIPDKYDLIIEIETEGKKINGIYMANNSVKILKGGSLEIKTLYSEVIAQVININELEG